MTSFDLLELALFAHRGGRGKPMEPWVVAIFGGVLLLFGLLVLSLAFARRNPDSKDGGGSVLVTGIVPTALGYGLLANSVGLPGGSAALQLGGWIVALGGLMLPRMLWNPWSKSDALDRLRPSAASPEERLAPWLAPGERVLWSGGPEPRCFREEAALNAFFGICFLAAGGGGAATLVNHLLREGVQWPYLSAVVIGFEAAGLALYSAAILLASPWAIRSRAPRTLYAVTDRRGVVLAPPYGLWSLVPLRKPQPPPLDSDVPAESNGDADALSEFVPGEMLFRTLKKRNWVGVDLVFASETTGSGKNRRTIEYGFIGLADAEAAAAAEASIEQAFRRPETGRTAENAEGRSALGGAASRGEGSTE